MPRNENFKCVSQFMFSSVGTLRIFFLTEMCTKRLVSMCAKFCENM